MKDRVRTVLVDLAPEVFAEAVGRTLTDAGFRVLTKAPAAASFDAVVVSPGRPGGNAPISLLVGGGTSLLVHQGSEIGLVPAEGPGDLVNVLQVLLGDDP